jgi:hypothetical protein
MVMILVRVSAFLVVRFLVVVVVVRRARVDFLFVDGDTDGDVESLLDDDEEDMETQRQSTHR